VAVAVNELYLDDDQVVDMVQVLADALLRVTGGDAPDEQITGCPSTDLADSMSGQGELSLVPLRNDLFRD